MQNDKIGIVYFARDARGMTKIGFTHNLSARVSSLKSNGADLVEVMHVMIYAAPYLERYFHRKFEARKVRGEWYLLDENDWEWVRAWFNRYAEYCNHTGKMGNGRYYWNPELVSWVQTAWWQPKDLAEPQGFSVN